MLDPASRFLDTDDAGNQTDVMRKSATFDKPIQSCELMSAYPHSLSIRLKRSSKTNAALT